jgi:tetratricopeptide (TPR) repeat protein
VNPPPVQNKKKDLTSRLTQQAAAWQRILERDPRHPHALIGMSLIALASRQFDAAVKMARAGTEAAPAMPTAWVALGQALNAADQNIEAGHAYRQAIRLDGMDAMARMGLGELHLANTQPEAAINEFEFALAKQPSLAGALLGLGNALALMQRDNEALARYEEALILRPRLPEAEFAAGFVLARMGRPQQAETRYRRAIAARPDFAAAWMNLGSLLREQGREAYAEAALRRAVALRPDLVSGWINLAVLERERCRPSACEALLQKALDLNPNQVETLIGWCQFRLSEHDLPDAWRWLNRALGLDPKQNEAVNMKGILLHNEGRFPEAVAAFQQAEALGNRAAASNRGNSLLDMGRASEALRAHESAVEQDPTHAGAAYNLALTQLRLGDWARGWPGYEARWRFREVHRRPRVFSVPRWRGQQLAGEHILLHAEQGLGDTIQFCRYACLVAARGGFPILQVQQPVERLMHSLALVRAGRAQVAVPGSAGNPANSSPTNSAFDLECPLMSLPTIFATNLDTVPCSDVSTGPYLAADLIAARQKLTAFPSLHPGPRIGLAWAGNPRYKADRQRSMHLETLLPLLRRTPANWISLQKGDPAQQLFALPSDIRPQDGCSQDYDLAETAALIATLDLVITTDTCIAHLAGAMAKPVWILLPHLSDWRWMQNRETTPWYPTARLFRQTTPGDWSAVLTRVAEELATLHPHPSAFMQSRTHAQRDIPAGAA